VQDPASSVDFPDRLISGIQLLQVGSNEVADGIRGSDQAKVGQGAANIQTGSSDIQQVMTQLPQAWHAGCCMGRLPDWQAWYWSCCMGRSPLWPGWHGRCCGRS
jgi:hypothetical protein